MGANKSSDISKVGHDVLGTTQSQQTGLVTAQLGDVVTEDATSHDAEWYYPPGLVSRPRKPDPKKKAAQVVAITRSGNDAIVGCRDERVLDIIGQLDDGETAVFAPASGGGVTFFRKDGSIKTQNANGSVELKPDGTVLVGDDNAATLADGSALNTVIQLLQGIAATWIALTPPSTPITAGALNGYGQTIQQTLNAIAKVQTTKAKGT